MMSPCDCVIRRIFSGTACAGVQCITQCVVHNDIHPSSQPFTHHHPAPSFPFPPGGLCPAGPARPHSGMRRRAGGGGGGAAAIPERPGEHQRADTRPAGAERQFEVRGRELGCCYERCVLSVFPILTSPLHPSKPSSLVATHSLYSHVPHPSPLPLPAALAWTTVARQASAWGRCWRAWWCRRGWCRT